MELPVYIQMYIDTVEYYNLNVFERVVVDYTHTINNKEREVEKKKEIIFCIAEYLEKNILYPKNYKRYACYHYLAPMTNSFLSLFEKCEQGSNIYYFLRNFEAYSSVANYVFEYIKEKGEKAFILEQYKKQCISSDTNQEIN